ncbi:hypothetical protein C8N35_1011578 [Breoghania corrubedonensis]|uniref:Uncharacterized protein n=1 Tax=Breoghania corrubedonensis TaxID=665038 RepID=A0A2T5VIE7_9HYPH|nr:hypothetical protein [Breoghania corrubedonensis]PTW63524.1 hypothetical protein C8N35_1011578 [Breoghania corrubedonensis]
MRKFWILLAMATVAVVYFAVAPGGPLSVEPHASIADSTADTQTALRETASLPLERVASGEQTVAVDIETAMNDASTTRGSDPIIGETLDRMLGLIDLGKGKRADS